MSVRFQKFEEALKKAVLKAFQKAYPDTEISLDQISFNQPPSLDQGDLALGCFPWAKVLRTSPAEIAKKLSQHLKDSRIEEVLSVGPYLNMKLKREKFFELVVEEILKQGDAFGPTPTASPEKIMLEYSSPNTNKPMHLGHVRNNTLGVALGNLLKALGHQVLLVNLVNDRGIHICKSMVAYQRWGKGETPQSTAIKGDHFVGKYYVQFDQQVKLEREKYLKKARLPFSQISLTTEEWAHLIGKEKVVAPEKVKEALQEAPNKPLDKILLEKKIIDKKLRQKILDLRKGEEEKRQDHWNQVEREFQAQCSLLQEASEMLRKWEEGDPEVRGLWETMNSWVYQGFDETYRRLGCTFDLWNYESETYKLGKSVVDKHLGKGCFYQKEDSSIWAKLDGKRSGFPLQDKLVLRKDGTSVYITQDLGTALDRFEKHHPDRLVYVVASEQNLHFANLFEILSRLGYQWAEKCRHAAYGMVTLPEGRGKLKSRDGTAADADALLDEVKEISRQKIIENNFCEEKEEIDKNAEFVALGTLKFLILRVTLGKDLQFDPDQDIQLTGDSGPAVQYSYPRIRSIYRKAPPALKKALEKEEIDYSLLIEKDEWELARLLFAFPSVVEKSAEDFSPSTLANYLLDLTKSYARFFNNCPVIKGTEKRELKLGRLKLCLAVAVVLKKGLELLGIPVPEKM